MTAYYAYTPRVDPLTGQITAWGTDLRPGQPSAEMVALTLRTPLGSYAPDPDEGVDLSIVQSATQNVANVWKAEVERALARYVRNGVIRDLQVTVDLQSDGQLLYDVAFVDPRDTTQPVELRRLSP